MEQSKIVNTVLTVIAVIAAYIFIVRPYIGTHWDMAYKQGLNDAVNGCLKAATLTYTESGTGATHNEPNNDWYERCMKDKGY